MDLKARRLKEGWSQQHLAEISGLSDRTIQRIENGEKASLESTKALSAAFNISSAELRMPTACSQENDHMPLSAKRNGFLFSISKPWKQVAIHFGAFMFFMTWLSLLQSMLGFDSDVLGAIGITWGSLLALHAIKALGGEDENDKQANKQNNK
ncbi:MAG: helix-turn-helix transcriptional regulator [Robiginitomaculum sp.]|nr:helix-turn-helix transcriptional regulator [Robiginitomaculum sp.]MDQ7078682.1 helix-turn-helix transcriptional regulator [Robiginitomaculum sp.]